MDQPTSPNHPISHPSKLGRISTMPLFRKRRESELQRELRSHLEAEADDRLADGLDPAAAHHAALRALGNSTLIQEDVRMTWGWSRLETVLQDLRYAARILRRNPGFGAAAALALALGIGANTAAFSVFESTLLRPLPFPDPEQLVCLWDSYGSRGNTGPVSYPNFQDWRAWNRSFSDLAAYSHDSATLTGYGEPRHLSGIAASASLGQVLGFQPAAGRLFRPEEDVPGANSGGDSIMISESLWQEILGGRADALGKTLLLDGTPYILTGVLPRSLDARAGLGKPDFLVTMASSARPRAGARPVTEVRTISFLSAIGRLRPGVTLARAQPDMDRVAALLQNAYPKDDPQEGVEIRGLQQTLTGDVKPVLTALLACAGFVLLVACADIAGLVLARAAGRRREMAVRAAIGAGRWRIVRQLLVESAVLSSIGCAGGLWLATLLGALLSKALRIEPVPTLDLTVLGFAALLAVLSAAIFSLAPALHYFKSDLIQRLRESSLNSSEGVGQRRAQGVLVVAQMALAMVLVSSSGLLAVSVYRLRSVPLGFAPDHVLTFPVILSSERYPQAQRAAFFDDLTARLHAIPGVLAAGAGGQLPLEGSISRTVISSVDGAPVRRAGIAFASVTPQYFRALGMSVRRGREFTAGDTAAAPPVVILNEAAVRRYFPKADPIGREVVPEMWNASGSTTRPRTVVGVVGDVKLSALTANATPAIYWPIAQIPSDAALYVTVRTASDPLTAAGAVRQQLHAADRDLPLYNLFPLAHYVDDQLSLPQSTTALVAGMALLALVLTAVGLYGVIGYSVARHTREIGIRMALGASRGGILRAFLRSGLLAGVLGAAIGWPGAVASARMLRSQLFGIGTQQPLILAAGAITLVAVAGLASYLPARRATRIDPNSALRYE